MQSKTDANLRQPPSLAPNIRFPKNKSKIAKKEFQIRKKEFQVGKNRFEIGQEGCEVGKNRFGIGEKGYEVGENRLEVGEKGFEIAKGSIVNGKMNIGQPVASSRRGWTFRRSASSLRWSTFGQGFPVEVAGVPWRPGTLCRSSASRGSLVARPKPLCPVPLPLPIRSHRKSHLALGVIVIQDHLQHLHRRHNLLVRQVRGAAHLATFICHVGTAYPHVPARIVETGLSVPQ